MELKEFIKNTILEISKAVEESRNNLQGDIEVASYNSDKTANTYPVTREINFDVAVVVLNEASGDINGKIKVFSLTLGAEASDKNSNSTSSRISFSIPITFSKNEYISKEIEVIKDKSFNDYI